MLKVIIACDEEDKKAGHFFKECTLHISNKLLTLDVDIEVINKTRLNEAYVSLKMDELKDVKFLFFAYSHGGTDCLDCPDGIYLRKQGDLSPFNKAFFYSHACFAGQELGKELISHGCSSFFGFIEKVYFITCYEDTFISCANFGFEKMIEGHSTGDALELMRVNYEDMSDFYSGKNDLVAATLLENRDSLILHGDRDLSLADLFN